MYRFIIEPVVVLLQSPFFFFLRTYNYATSHSIVDRNIDVVLIHWQTYEITFYGAHVMSDTFANMSDILQAITKLGQITKNTNVKWHFWKYLKLYFSIRVYILTALEIHKIKHKIFLILSFTSWGYLKMSCKLLKYEYLGFADYYILEYYTI
jgi:hypothetical protein